MTDRPILFSAPMVRALLAGTKTQTRRTLNPQPTINSAGLLNWSAHGTSIQGPPEHIALFGLRIAKGDRLYVREEYSGQWEFSTIPPKEWPAGSAIWCWADGNPQGGDWTKPRRAMHMCRWMSRITLHVTEVRVQRLQEISDADCIAEGVQRFEDKVGGGWMVPDLIVADSPRSTYFGLLDHLHGQGFSVANPWLAAYTFEVERCNIAEARK